MALTLYLQQGHWFSLILVYDIKSANIFVLYWQALLALMQMLERMRAEAAAAQQVSEERHTQDVEAIRVATEDRIQVMVLRCTHAYTPQSLAASSCTRLTNVQI